jgi:hypothetical protein
MHLQDREAAVEELMDKFAKQALEAAAKVRVGFQAHQWQ